MLCAVDPVTHQGGMPRDLRGGQVKVPGVIRLPCGAGQGAGPHHAQRLYSWFVHAPDIKVALKYPKI
jgi:pyruvate/2-oxoglutarate/acetoin dehydrogenase E1 component